MSDENMGGLEDYLDDLMNEDLEDIERLGNLKSQFPTKKEHVKKKSRGKEAGLPSFQDKTDLTKNTKNGDNSDKALADLLSDELADVSKGVKGDVDKEIAETTSGLTDNEHDDSVDNEDDELSEFALKVLNWDWPEPKSRPDMIENEWIRTGWIGHLHVDKILTEAIMTGSSDVHLTANQKISMSRNGEIVKYDGYEIPDSDVMQLLIHEAMLSNQEQASLNKEGEFDGAYVLQYGPYAGSRTRINVGRSFGSYFVVFRVINDFIPALEDLGVEDEIIEWSNYPNGLFLLCGPTGTGKSTTLASVVHNLMLSSRKKIITIEKPIEYIYPDDTPSLVVQREVGGDTRGFYQGLTSAMRQNPDVILLGEVRNTEEVTELLRAAETGHLAISTMHTNSVATTINRIQNLFDGNEQRRIMSTLADTLRGIGNQVLVKDMTGESRFAVREILTINQEVRELIVKGDVQGIRAYQIANEATMEHNLARAVKDGKCLREEAVKQVADPLLFRSLLDD